MLNGVSARDFILKLDEIIGIIAESAKRGLSAKLVYNTIIYLASGRERGDVDRFINKIAHSELHNYKGDVMLWEESLIQEGMQRGMQTGMQAGRQEGIQETQREIAREFLRSGVDSAIVAKAAHLTMAEVEELKKSVK